VSSVVSAPTPSRSIGSSADISPKVPSDKSTRVTVVGVGVASQPVPALVRLKEVK